MADTVTEFVDQAYPGNPGLGTILQTFAGLPAIDSIDSITVEFAHTWGDDVIVTVEAPNGGLFNLLSNSLNAEGTNWDAGQAAGSGGLANVAAYEFVEFGTPFSTITDAELLGGESGIQAIAWPAGPFPAGDWTFRFSDAVGADGGAVGAVTIEYSPLEECGLPGRRSDEDSSERVLRGFIVGWAVNENNEEIRFNHLSGSADVVNYLKASAAQYDAWAFQSVDPAVGHGEPTGTPGELNFNGNEFSPAYNQLIMNFYAVGAASFSNQDHVATAEPDLTLHPVSADFTDSGLPVITKAHFDVWNENEVKFSGAYRCVTCWDQTLLDDYGVPNHFLVYTLQSNFGKARIDGVASPLCENSVDAALLGVQMREVVAINGAIHNASTGANLIGLGTETATLSYAPVSDPPESPGAGIGLKKQSALASSRGGREAEVPMASGVGGDQDRVSGSDKGSVLYWSAVEVRWDLAGELIQDTFLTITNDYPEDVRVQLYFVNGDEPYYDDLCGEFHPGWNFLDNEITLTANQPGYWSAATGLGTFGGLSPFTVLDP